MKNTYFSRRFIYSVNPQLIKDYLLGIGFETRERLDETGLPVAFEVMGTTIDVSYRPMVNGHIIGEPIVSLLNSSADIDHDPDIAMKSVSLYNKLYRKFRKK